MDLTYIQFLQIVDLLDGTLFTAYKKSTLFQTDAALLNLLRLAFFLFQEKFSNFFLIEFIPTQQPHQKINYYAISTNQTLNCQLEFQSLICNTLNLSSLRN